MYDLNHVRMYPAASIDAFDHSTFDVQPSQCPAFLEAVIKEAAVRNGSGCLWL